MAVVLSGRQRLSAALPVLHFQRHRRLLIRHHRRNRPPAEVVDQDLVNLPRANPELHPSPPLPIRIGVNLHISTETLAQSRLILTLTNLTPPQLLRHPLHRLRQAPNLDLQFLSRRLRVCRKSLRPAEERHPRRRRSRRQRPHPVAPRLRKRLIRTRVRRQRRERRPQPLPQEVEEEGVEVGFQKWLGPFCPRRPGPLK